MRGKKLNSFYSWAFPRVLIVTFFSSLLLAPWAAFATGQKDNPSKPRTSSNVLFTFPDQSTLTMSEDTIFNINNQSYNPDTEVREIIITVSQGWVHFKATKEKNNEYTYKIVTPSATAGVHGKEFQAIVDAKEKTTFRALEGQVETFSNLSKGNKEKPFVVSAGEVQNFFPDGSHSPVRRLLRNF